MSAPASRTRVGLSLDHALRLAEHPECWLCRECNVVNFAADACRCGGTIDQTSAEQREPRQSGSLVEDLDVLEDSKLPREDRPSTMRLRAQISSLIVQSWEIEDALGGVVTEDLAEDLVAVAQRLRAYLRELETLFRIVALTALAGDGYQAITAVIDQAIALGVPGLVDLRAQLVATIGKEAADETK